MKAEIIEPSLTDADNAPRLVDPLTFPLYGSRLIEASAGTGKTYTIAALYLRLVLGHGVTGESADDLAENDESHIENGNADSNRSGIGRALTPPEILVVTYTDAATKELRDRIRARLAEAAGVFSMVAVQWTQAAPEAFDDETRAAWIDAITHAVKEPFLTGLLRGIPPGEWAASAQKLRIASEWMDEAAVSTIHGWCNRMLGEHAFDSDSLFTQRLATDQSDLLAEAVRDYWRTFLYPLDASAADTVLQWWRRPDEAAEADAFGFNKSKPSLYEQVDRLRGHAAVLPKGQVPAAAIAAAATDARRMFDALRAPFPDWLDEFERVLIDALDSKKASGTKLRRASIATWFGVLREWAASDAGPGLPTLTKAAWERLTAAGLADAWKDGVGPTHPCLDALATLRERVAALPDARDDVLCHAVHWVAARFAEEQAQRAEMGFDDLLSRLDAALRGANGSRLAELIRRQFPVAMIDEFQDTDSTQYNIFDSIYKVDSRPVSKPDSKPDSKPKSQFRADTDFDVGEDAGVHAKVNSTALILIGDPKQAIYKFRGADIFTYLRARDATVGRHYTLGTNFRSTVAMVASVNHCFMQAEQRHDGRGAFLFRSRAQTAAGDAGGLPFVPVNARGRPETWWIDGEAAPALTVWWNDTVDTSNGEGADENNEENHGADKPAAPVNPSAEGAANRSVNASATASACASSGALPATGELMKSGAHRTLFAEVCARRIATLLGLGRAGRAGFVAAGMNDAADAIDATNAIDAIDSAIDSAGRHATTSFRAVQPADIAVLVNTRREARAVRRALQACGVRSVYLSDQESVFASACADDMHRWLTACAAPDDDRLLRAALGTPLLGLDWTSLDRLNEDEITWEAYVMRFRGYRQRWRRQGVLPMLHRFLHDFGVPGRMLASGDERALTDILHLAELLQQASTLLDGEHALIRYLAEQRRDLRQQNDARKLRLESDADLVKVITIHKSKGLEYPLVFLPFASAFRATESTDLPLVWHDDEHALHVSLRADGDVTMRADDERLGEDLRKLYVALTRARFATWIGVAPIKHMERGALGYLLHGDVPLDPATLAARLPEILQTFKGECDDIAIVRAADDHDADALQRLSVIDVRVRELSPALSLPRPTGTPWWVTSYTALASLAKGAGSIVGTLDLKQAESAAEDRYLEAADERDPYDLDPFYDAYGHGDNERYGAQDGAFPDDHVAMATPAFEDQSAADGSVAGTPGLDLMHDFPRGKGPGSFLHGLLEWAGREGFDRIAATVEPETGMDGETPGTAYDSLREQIARRCKVRGWERFVDPLTSWLRHWLRVALPLPLPLLADASSVPSLPVTLASLRGYQVEMEFWFSLRNVAAPPLDAIVSSHTLDGARRAALAPHRLNGMLKGFIDLVFEHEGRYYVADYKSNRLGDDAQAYTDAAMTQAVLNERYDLQYALYVFALHRLLQSRLPDYDYDEHVGGALYLFLRGANATTHGVFHARPPRAMIEAMEALFREDGA